MNSTSEENCIISHEQYNEYLRISAYVFLSLLAICAGCLTKLCCCK